MKSVKVLGTGCQKCRITVDNIRVLAETVGVEVDLEKVEDVVEIARYGVTSTPAVVVDGVVVHTGSVPTKKMIGNWIR